MTYVIFMPDDNTKAPPVELGYLAGVNANGQYVWTKDVDKAVKYDTVDKAWNVLLGDPRLKAGEKDDPTRARPVPLP